MSVSLEVLQALGKHALTDLAIEEFGPQRTARTSQHHLALYAARFDVSECEPGDGEDASVGRVYREVRYDDPDYSRAFGSANTFSERSWPQQEVFFLSQPEPSNGSTARKAWLHRSGGRNEGLFVLQSMLLNGRAP